MSAMFVSRDAFASGQGVEELEKVPNSGLEVVTKKNGRPRHKYHFYMQIGFYLSIMSILTGIAMHIAEYSMMATEKG